MPGTDMEAHIPADHRARSTVRDGVWSLEVRPGHRLLVWYDDVKWGITHAHGEELRYRLCDERLPRIWTAERIETFQHHYRWAYRHIMSGGWA